MDDLFHLRVEISKQMAVSPVPRKNIAAVASILGRNKSLHRQLFAFIREEFRNVSASWEQSNLRPNCR